MDGPVGVNYAGLPELLSALKAVDVDLLAQVKDSLGEAGGVVRDRARTLFVEHFANDGRSLVSAMSVVNTASGFEARVRVGPQAVLVVAQSLPSKTRKRGDWGGDMMRRGLVPARTETIGEVTEMIENGVADLLHRNGF